MSAFEPAWNSLWPGQAALWRTVSRLGREGRVPGSLLVIGMRGVPSTPYADALADGLLCPAAVGGRACATCPDCRLVRALSHPDRLVVRPEGNQVRIDAVRAAVTWAAYRPQRAAVRVVRLDRADRMGGEAAVAALKAVEEPPATTHWVLSADAPGRVPGPLRSRCVPFTLRTVPAAEIAAWLGQIGVEASTAAASAAAASGFPEDARASAAASPDAAEALGEDPERLAQMLRRDLHDALRAGRLSGREARAVLSLWSLADQGIRRASPPRLVADVLRAATERLPAAAP